MAVQILHSTGALPLDILHTLDAARVPALLVDLEANPLGWNSTAAQLIYDPRRPAADGIRELARQAGPTASPHVSEREILVDVGARFLHARVRVEPLAEGIALLTVPFRSVIQSPRALHEPTSRRGGADLHTLFANAAFGSFFLEPQLGTRGEVVDFLLATVNDAGAQQMGFARGDLEGRSVRATFPANETLGLFPLMVRAYQEQRGFSHDVEVPDDTTGGGSWGIHVLPTPGGLFLLNHDRSQRRVEAERHAAALEAMHDAVLLLTGAGVVVSTNDAAERLLDAPPDGLVGLPFEQLLADDARATWVRLVQRSTRLGGAPPLEVRVQPIGGPTAIPARASVVRYQSAGEEGLVVSLHDLRPLRSLEGQLHSAQKIEALGTLAAEVAHDLRNLLQVVSGNAEDIVDQSLEGIGPQLEDILAATDQATELCQSLLTFARTGEQTTSGALDAHAFLERTARVLQRALGHDHHLLPTLDDTLRGTVLPISEQSLSQVLLNLMVNARDAMPDGGEVHLGLNPGEPGEVVLTVRDTGEGMPPSVAERIFDPFFTTKPAGVGTGLGLATVMSVMHRCGGRVDLQTAPGEGTTFALYFPVDRSTGDAG